MDRATDDKTRVGHTHRDAPALGVRATRRTVLRYAGAAAAVVTLSPLLAGSARAQAAAKRIRFAHPAPAAHGWQIWAEQFKKTIEEKSGGKMQVQIFPNAQMGNERDTAQAVRIGSLEMGAMASG